MLNHHFLFLFQLERRVGSKLTMKRYLSDIVPLSQLVFIIGTFYCKV